MHIYEHIYIYDFVPLVCVVLHFSELLRQLFYVCLSTMSDLAISNSMSEFKSILTSNAFGISILPTLHITMNTQCC